MSVGKVLTDTLGDDLPNLKIEIENEVQRMETEAEGSLHSILSETEEGEVVDEDDDLEFLKAKSTFGHPSQFVPSGRSILKYDTKEYVDLHHQQAAAVKNPNGAFVTGVNIFSPDEQAKLDKRAQRFGIENSEVKALTETLLKNLYISMGVNPTDKNVRTEALHLQGTKDMATQDVFSYFKDYGPASLEWITENSCNVVWLDDISAARALLGLSVHISGQRKSTRAPSQSQSQSGSDIEMDEAPTETDNLSDESDAVPVADLEVKLPPGRWRRGKPHTLSSCILLRFATVDDRRIPRPDLVKFGNHQIEGYVGLISESRRRRMLNALPTPLMFDDVGDEIIPKPSLEDKDSTNPWGTLAKTWSQFDKVRKPRPPSPTIERILPLPPRMTPPPSPPIFSCRPKLVARRRQADHVSDSSDGEWCSRSKVPRMRMHADDEEKKLKRTRRPRSRSTSPTRPRDLRKHLAIVKRERGSDGEDSTESEPAAEVEKPEEDEIPDLRVAVPAERADSPEDSKGGIRQNLFQSGNVRSVLRGARGHSDNDEEEGSEESEKISSRRHRSQSKERRRHHKKHKKESHHRNRRKNSDSDSIESINKTVRSTIKRINTEKERRRSESRERRREKGSSWHEERRKNRDGFRRSEIVQKQETRRYEEQRTSKDLRDKLSQRNKEFDSHNEFRSKSPLQIEIDNDEYYRTVEKD